MKKLIFDFLNRNFELIISKSHFGDGGIPFHRYYVVDKYRIPDSGFFKAIEILRLVFGDFYFVDLFYEEWVQIKTDKKEQELLAFIASLDLMSGTKGLLNKLKYDGSLANYERLGIFSYVMNWYFDKYIKKQLDDLILNYEDSDNDIFTSKLKGIVSSKEENLLENMVIDYVNNNLFEAYSKPKLDSFLEKCTLVLGNTQWDINHENFGIVDINLIPSLICGGVKNKVQVDKIKRYLLHWRRDMEITETEKAIKLI